MTIAEQPFTKRSYGRIADLPDQRDHTFKVARRAKAVLPASIDGSRTDWGISDQGDLGSCTGHGSVGALRNLLTFIKEPDWEGSRLAAYYFARSLEGTTKIDAGAQIRDAMKGIQKNGLPLESAWPYTESKFATRPSAAALKSGLRWEDVTYASVDNTDKEQVMAAIAQHGNLVVGITVYESFESAAVAKSGVVPMPKKTERVLGGHCIRAIGYNKSTVQLSNSWSEAWGKAGRFTLPWAYITNPALCSDCWAWVTS